MKSDIEEYVFIFGEEYRKLITESLTWVKGREKDWGFKINRFEFVSGLIEYSKKGV